MAGKRDTKVETRLEAELLLCFARTFQDEETRLRREALLKQKVDWDYLLELALRHRVMPLLYRHLNSFCPEAIPAQFMERLRDYFYLNAARNHLLTEALCEALELFESSGINCVPYKGPVLAKRLYGDAAYRQFSDLDIFIRAKDVARASELLRLHGYRREIELASALEAAFLKVGCEHMFKRERGRVFLELHWGFAPTYFPLRLNSESMWQRLEPLRIGNTGARTFSVEDLLLILCLNAGKDFWRELGSLCDVAQLISTTPELDWEQAIGEATGARMRRMLLTSISLAHELLGAIIPEHVIQSIETDRTIGPLASAARQNLFHAERESRETVSQFLKPARALDGLKDRAKFHSRLALTPTLEDWTFIKLPASLRFLHYLTRPLRLVKKYLLHQRTNL